MEEKKQREDMVDVLSSTVFRQTLLDARGEEIVAVRRRMIRKLSQIFKPTHELESNGSPRRSYFDGTSEYYLRCDRHQLYTISDMILNPPTEATHCPERTSRLTLGAGSERDLP